MDDEFRLIVLGLPKLMKTTYVPAGVDEEIKMMAATALEGAEAATKLHEVAAMMPNEAWQGWLAMKDVPDTVKDLPM